MLPVVTLIQACTSRTNSRNGAWPAGSQRGPGRPSVVSAPHMSHRTSKNDPYEPKDSNPNPMAS
eukprot:5497016-Pyramimonas_sp.AAC.1